MIRVTLDTNVLISATFWTGDSCTIARMIDSGQIECVLSPEIIKEYTEVSTRDELLDRTIRRSTAIGNSSERLLTACQTVNPTQKLNLVKKDPSDNKILECALEGKAQFIITNDRHLLELKEVRGIRILTPAEFLDAAAPPRNMKK